MPVGEYWCEPRDANVIVWFCFGAIVEIKLVFSSKYIFAGKIFIEAFWLTVLSPT